MIDFIKLSYRPWPYALSKANRNEKLIWNLAKITQCQWDGHWESLLPARQFPPRWDGQEFRKEHAHAPERE